MCKSPLTNPARHVVILGTGPSTRGAAPYDDPEVDIWTIARGMWIPPRVSLLFELHHEGLWDGWGDKAGTILYKDLLAQWDKTPILMQEHRPEIPQSVTFPKDEVLDTLKTMGHPDPAYQTSQVSWMLSYALHLGIPHISFYGIDLISEGEARSYQRHCLEYLVGLARGAGHQVTIADQSSLCKQRIGGANALYGYDYPKTRDEAVVIYGHPMRQIVKRKDGSIADVKEVPGLFGMPLLGKGGSNDMKVVSNLPENMRAMHQGAPTAP